MRNQRAEMLRQKQTEIEMHGSNVIFDVEQNKFTHVDYPKHKARSANNSIDFNGSQVENGKKLIKNIISKTR